MLLPAMLPADDLAAEGSSAKGGGSVVRSVIGGDFVVGGGPLVEGGIIVEEGGSGAPENR